MKNDLFLNIHFSLILLTQDKYNNSQYGGKI